jgi:hypothetical protein
MLAVVTAAVIAVPTLRPIGILIAATCCFCATLLFAVIWPAKSWQWGVWLSAGFWLYFAFVFTAIAVKGEIDWLPAIYAIGLLAAACVAGIIGQRLSPRLLKLGR